MSMIIHAGGEMIPKEEIYKVPTPNATQTWRPIPHGFLLGLVEARIEKMEGVEIVGSTHALSHAGARYFGMLEIADSNKPVNGYSVVIGLRNCHDKTFLANMCCGSHVFVCDNLAFSAEIVIGRKHTRWILRDLPNMVSDALGRLQFMQQKQAERIEAYRTTNLIDPVFHDTLIGCIDANVLPASKVPKVLDLWRGNAVGLDTIAWGPDHEQEFAGKTVWRAFNAVTSVLKTANVFDLPRRTQDLHHIMDVRCGMEESKPN